MSDIFISYASEDRERAKELADALAARGWSVWWDRQIPIGRSFSEVIEEQLAAARCVIVLWSEESVKSQWVQNEAADGAAREILVPALIADVRLPLEFRRLQTANLAEWQPGTTTPELEHLMTSVAALVQPDVVREIATAPENPTPPRFPRTQVSMFAAALLAIALIVTIVLWITNRHRPSDPPTDTAETAGTTGTTVTTDTGTTKATEPPRPVADPARAVGVLLVNGRPRCTAFLIANDVAVTAPSCFEPSSRLILKLGSRTAQSRATDYPVESVLVRDERKGIAALRVSGSPGKTFPKISHHTRPVRPGENVTVLHYDQVRPPSAIRCNVVEVRNEELLYRCATRAVDAGSPILGSDNSLLGVHAGGVRKDDPKLNRGIPTSMFLGAIFHYWEAR